MFLNKKNFPPIFCLKCQSQKISAVLFRKMHFSKRFRSKLHPSEIRTDALIVQVKGFLLLGRTKFEQGVFFYLSWRWCCDKFDLSHRSSLLYHHHFLTVTLHESVFTLYSDFLFYFSNDGFTLLGWYQQTSTTDITYYTSVWHFETQKSWVA